MLTLSATTPYDIAWSETTMPLNIGGDQRRAICLYSDAGVTCDGVYSIWVRSKTDPWLRLGAAVTVAASAKGHALGDLESMNCFDKVYVSAAGGAAADRWFVASGGNQGYA